MEIKVFWLQLSNFGLFWSNSRLILRPRFMFVRSSSLTVWDLFDFQAPPVVCCPVFGYRFALEVKQDRGARNSFIKSEVDLFGVGLVEVHFGAHFLSLCCVH